MNDWNIPRELLRKRYLIFGRGIIQETFEYLFDFLDVIGYIREEVPFLPEEKQIDIKNISGDSNEIIVVCKEEKEEAGAFLIEAGLVYKKNFLFADDMFLLLDEFRPDVLNGRKIAIWGTGDTYYNFEQQRKNNGYDVEVSLFLDGNREKQGTEFCGKPVKGLADVEDLQDYFVIVASVFYAEIKEELKGCGLEEGKDFLPYSSFYARPSAMAGEMLKAPVMEKGPACTRPFNFMYYAWFGVYCCCSTWVKHPIGNAIARTPEECWQSTVAKLYRLSMLNKTYAFCNHDACPFIHSDLMQGELTGEEYCGQPKDIMLGIDYSCNLKCASCRNEVKVVQGKQLELRKNMLKKLLDTDWLSTAQNFELSGSGEALFSPVYKIILFEDGAKRNTVSLLSNGLLLNKENWERLRSHFKHIKVNISIDAAFPETYEKIRRGGNWNVLMQNLDMLSRLRTAGELEYLEIRMVVQKLNYAEMPHFVELGKKYRADKVVFTRILNWDMYSTEEFDEISMVSADGAVKKELKEILDMPVMHEKIVVLNEFRKFMR